MLRALCLRFYQIFPFDLVFMLQSPYPDAHTICKCKSVGTVTSNRVFPVCACITYEKELLYVHHSKAQIENFTHTSNCSIICLYRGNYIFNQPNCLKLHYQPLEGVILIEPHNTLGWLGWTIYWRFCCSCKNVTFIHCAAPIQAFPHEKWKLQCDNYFFFTVGQLEKGHWEARNIGNQWFSWKAYTRVTILPLQKAH